MEFWSQWNESEGMATVWIDDFRSRLITEREESRAPAYPHLADGEPSTIRIDEDFRERAWTEPM